MTRVRLVGNVSDLPQNSFGAGSITWWGMFGLMLIEGITLVLVAGSYLYVRKNFYAWPPEGVPVPALGAALSNLVVLAVSLWPAYAAARAARRHDPGAVLRALVWQGLLGVAYMALSFVELRALHIRWDANAYGSVAWAVLIAHMLVSVTDVMDTIGLAALFALKEPEERHFVDTCENSQFWYFIVGSWMPLFVLVFLYPRWT